MWCWVAASVGRRAGWRAGRIGPAAAAVLILVACGLGVAAFRSVTHTGAGEVADSMVAPSSRTGTNPGAVAPSFAVPSYRGGAPLTLARFRGHPVVLNFWASWCPSCRAELPTLEAAYRQYRAQGVLVVGIDGATDTWPASRAFLAARGVTYPVGRDEQGEVARAYRVAAFPTTFFITPGGRVASIALTGGFTGRDGIAELRRQIEALLH
jgi:peroxiredoxin